MPRGIDNDPKRFREYLEKGVILIGGETVDNNSIDIEDDTPVSVAIMVNVTGYGPHIGAIAAGQGHIDEALQAAEEILEEWEMDHNPDYFAELEKEYGDERAPEVFRETFDGVMWELPVEEFLEAIKGTKAEEYIDVVEYEEEGDEFEVDVDFDVLAAELAAEHRRQGWTGNGRDYDIGAYHGDSEALEDALERKPSREELADFESAMRAALDEDE